MSRSQPIVLATARLSFRRLTLDDLDQLANLYRDPDVRRYFPEGILTYEETREELEYLVNILYGQHGYGLWATIHRESGEFIGRCGLLPWEIDGRSEVEVAYLLGKKFWARGWAARPRRLSGTTPSTC
jgi:ribosomal-protein-alanine N-acetyltransferase